MPHTHLPTLKLKDILNQREVLKTEAKSGSLNKPRRMIRGANHKLSAEVIAQLPTSDASRQAINRIRSSNVDGGVNPICREDVSISRELQTTYNGMKFLFEDTQDGDRILVFTTTENLNILRKNTWSVYQRILDGLPATNNPVESWHSALTVINYFNNSDTL